MKWNQKVDESDQMLSHYVSLKYHLPPNFMKFNPPDLYFKIERTNNEDKATQGFSENIEIFD